LIFYFNLIQNNWVWTSGFAGNNFKCCHGNPVYRLLPLGLRAEAGWWDRLGLWPDASIMETALSLRCPGGAHARPWNSGGILQASDQSSSGDRGGQDFSQSRAGVRPVLPSKRRQIRIHHFVETAEGRREERRRWRGSGEDLGGDGVRLVETDSSLSRCSSRALSESEVTRETEKSQ
ncbi:unnamed protein product, partial [Tetraodon nigroviridis]